MSIIGEAALSAFFEVLFKKLASSDLLKIIQQEQLDAELKKWKTSLSKIRAVLDDAEEKQMTSRLVKIWLDELQDLAYDADDILDEFANEALRRKLNAELGTSKVRNFLLACCVSFNSSFVMFDANMRSKIEDINTRLQKIVTEKNDLGLIENTGGRIRTTRSWVATTSLANEKQIYGRDKDKKAIVDLLLSRELSDAQLSVIPILGMGGLGKTTLAQLVYNDDDVNCYFDLKAWACVSDDFDIVRVTKVILESIIAPETYDVNDLNLLQVKLKEKLSDKKFLHILDDVWNEDYNDWTKLRSPFEFGAPGSKIIVTTRNHGVSLTMGTTPTYELKDLSNDACWRVFTQHALGATDFTMHPELEEIGRDILDKCKGSPLAAKVLGGLLRAKHSCDEWKNVLNSKIWDIPEEKSSILSILKLSYEYLPSHLKRCFAYCSLFPKDYKFKEKELVLLWMAEGLVQETERNKPMEDIGTQWAAGGLCYRLEDTLCGNNQSDIFKKTLLLKGCSRLTKLPMKIGNLVNLRHLDITNADSIKEMPMGIEELKNLQTLSNFLNRDNY
nr:putative disease resistance RPP13-like protein 1 [Quercus suber]